MAEKDRRQKVPVLCDGVVLLDELTHSDAAAQLAGEDDEHARRFGWYPRRSTMKTVESAIDEWQSQWSTSGPIRTFAVREATDRTLVGGCEIRLQSKNLAHMSYWIFPPYRRRGFASRAVRLATTYAFEKLDIERVDLEVAPDNHASRMVARNSGFTEEGVVYQKDDAGDTVHEMLLFSLYRGGNVRDPSISNAGTES